jgi:hypothetical protein
MFNTTDQIIKHKAGLLNLAEEFGNLSKACQVMRHILSQQSAIDDGGVEALFRPTRRKPNLAHWVGLYLSLVLWDDILLIKLANAKNQDYRNKD